jgi:dienelactone hydrolase
MAPRDLFSSLRALSASALGNAGAAFDAAVVNLALDRAGPKPSDAEAEAALEALARVSAAYADPRFITEPDTFFAPPDAAEVTVVATRPLRDGGAVDDLRARSAFSTVHPAPRDRYAAHANNAFAHARHLRHPTPRATVMCIHGYLGGALAFEERAFNARWLYDLGLDVLVTVLPFHGERATPGKRGIFPGKDPWRTVEGFAHAVSDLRAWSRWLRGRGAPRVMSFGMSLGGYTAALLATVDGSVAPAALMIPLASLADAYVEHREGRPDAPPAWIAPRIDDAYRVVSPFARTPRLRGEDIMVIAASGDRITRGSHAARLRAHFGDGPFETFVGGHMLQFGRGAAFESLARWLGDRGFTAPR